ncbi:MAG TPA: TonB-dependent receptor, partial [Blastocatellia bacterium]|nr:TonB-dependent receptor [Blastocatellia bacterium]
EDVEVKQDEQESRTDPRGNGFTRVLNEEQIAMLPDDPDELEKVLKQMAGPGATIRVNGFRGGKLPPKSQIRQIRFRLTPYSAEDHDEGFMMIDIVTKPTLDGWHGFLNLGFLDESLNARNAFAPARGSEQLRRFSFALSGPLKKDRTALFLSADSNVSFDTKTIYAATPQGVRSEVVRRPTRSLLLSARVEHELTKTHILRTEYQRSGSNQDNLGVGGFDLSDRAYSSNQTSQIFRLSDSGTIGKRFFNEFRSQISWQESKTNSLSQAPAIIVLNAFNSGGAGRQSERRSREIEITDNLDLPFEKHALRTGFQFEYGIYRSAELQNGNGTFTFSSLTAFLAGKPNTYSKREGNAQVSLSQHQFGWYVQDDMRVKKNLSLSFGLRYEFQDHLSDYKNFAPRFGIAWSPFKDGKTTIRAGSGVFYSWMGAEITEQILRVNGTRQSEIVILNPGYPDPQNNSQKNQATTLPPSRIVGGTGLQLPYLIRSSISVERQLNKFHVFADLRYERGIHLLRGRNINAPVPNQGRPDPDAGNLYQIESSARSWLRQLNIGFGPAMSMKPGRIFWFINYVLSKSVNEAESAFDLPADNYNLKGERGPASTDIRHRFMAMMQLSLPKNFRYGAFFNASSAAPYNITTGLDNNGDGVSNDRPADVTRNSARGAAQWDVSSRLSWSKSFGARNQSNGPGVMQMISVKLPSAGDGQMPAGGGFDPISSREMNKKYRMQIYVQASNLVNRTNPINFSGVQSSPFFGQATASLPARKIEVGMSFSF